MTLMHTTIFTTVIRATAHAHPGLGIHLSMAWKAA
jgi:hypothetical protein